MGFASFNRILTVLLSHRNRSYYFVHCNCSSSRFITATIVIEYHEVKTVNSCLISNKHLARTLVEYKLGY